MEPISRYHVAFLRPNPLARILNGVKTVECRLSRNRPPAWHTQAGDFLFLKETGGEVVAVCRAEWVTHFESLRPDDVKVLAELVAPLTGGSAQSPYWQSKEQARYAVIIGLSAVKRASLPAELTPRSVMTGWVANFPAASASRARLEL